HALDAEGGARDGVKGLATGDRMAPCDSVPHPAHPLLLLLAQHRCDRARTLVDIVPIAVVMQPDESVDAALGRFGEVVIRRILVREQRVAALARDLPR